MRTPVSIDLIRNTAAGKLSSNAHLFQVSDTKNKRKVRKENYAISEMHLMLQSWFMFKPYSLMIEYRFHEARKYRFDFAIPDLKIGIEYQGGIFMKTKSGHSNAKGATRDSDKMNLAQSLGWKVLTFTALNYRNVIQELEKLIK